jgi:glucosamine--fructose-6-phosphate aminotransferase (isomerizing)
MSIWGIGVDVVDVDRFRETLERTPGVRERIFTAGEAALSLESMAARFAAKEALIKALKVTVALEGALKLKELAYLHAEGFAGGELKHGPIAVVEEGTPVFAIVPSTSYAALRDKVISNIQEVRARGAQTVVLVEEGDDSALPFADHVIRLPKVPTLLQPLVATVPLQIFACELASQLGYDVDQPRNLAKSVTVE